MADSTTIFHLSDIHFGLEDKAALDWVAGEVAARRPDAVAITGDVTMRAKHREFAAAARWIADLDVPVTVEVGNHDMPYYNLHERFTQPYKRINALKAAVDRAIDLPGLVIIPLKTVRRWQPRWPWSKGWITPQALDRCLAAVDAVPSGVAVLIAAHHPLREAGTHGTALTRNGGLALDALARRKVLGVISGHVHDPFDLVEQTGHGPVRMIGAGTMSERLRATPPSFNELGWDGEVLTCKIRTLD